MVQLKRLKRHLANLPGWRTSRKIVVFESDDWGTIRMPSKQAFNALLKKGIRVDKSNYDTLDSLEQGEDLDRLFNVLSSHRNNRGEHAKFTFNAVMTNPHFEKIKEANYEHFVYESLFDSYQRYYGEDLKALWAKGMENKLFTPQFHAREHLNSNLWMRDLRKGVKDTRNAFDHHFFGLKTVTSSPHQWHYLSAYSAESEQELEQTQSIIEEGLQLFETFFGFQSTSFIGCNYVWPKELEPFLQKRGVKYLQGQRGQVAPTLNAGKRKVYYHYTGQKNKVGQRYLVRNAIFEPYQNQETDWVSNTLQAIADSFRLKKPAIISTHRINYASNMKVKNRDASLKKLDQLLKGIIEKWPEIEFLSSNELGTIISHENSYSQQQ